MLVTSSKWNLKSPSSNRASTVLTVTYYHTPHFFQLSRSQWNSSKFSFERLWSGWSQRPRQKRRTSTGSWWSVKSLKSPTLQSWKNGAMKKVLTRKVQLLESPSTPRYIAPNLTYLSRAMFSLLYACGGLPGPLLSPIFLSLGVLGLFSLGHFSLGLFTRERMNPLQLLVFCSKTAFQPKISFNWFSTPKSWVWESLHLCECIYCKNN